MEAVEDKAPPALAYYPLVAQDCRRAELYSREEGGHWVHTVFEESGQFSIQAPGYASRLSLGDIYEDVALD